MWKFRKKSLACVTIILSVSCFVIFLVSIVEGDQVNKIRQTRKVVDDEELTSHDDEAMLASVEEDLSEDEDDNDISSDVTSADNASEPFLFPHGRALNRESSL